MGDGPIPSFRRPPVIETILGVQFIPLDGWTIGHFGLFWNRIRGAFPKIEVKQTLAPLTAESEIRVEVRQTPEARCWFIGTQPSELVQVQSDRFLTNWRQTDASVPYPRYVERILPFFQAQWLSFLSFLEDERIPAPIVMQCEMNYVNHIEKGEGWETAAEWDRVFTVCGSVGGGDKYLPNPEARSFNFNYPLANNRGTLTASASRAIRTYDGKDIILFQLVARGSAVSSELKELIAWMGDAHDSIVRAFAELTTEQMHKRWERER
jgi:uncharacterized protein (TIGR04255 family)